MNKRIIILIIILCLGLLPGCAVSTSLPSHYPDPADPSNDFGFIFTSERESEGECILNTFENKYKSGIFPKEMKLSSNDLLMIRNKMAEIDFFNYPDKFEINSHGAIVSWSDHYSYNLSVIDRQNSKKLTLIDDTLADDIKLDNLRLLMNMIKDTIDLKNSKQKESEFNFVFRSGHNADLPDGGNCLNTFKGMYSRDMVREAPATTNLTITEEEKNIILQKMKNIDFFNYPTNFNPPSNIYPSTPFGYYFRVKSGFQYKEIIWSYDRMSQVKQANDLRELANTIFNIIESKKEYQALPTPKSGYI